MTTCSSRSRALGLTLIEVVTALAILGTLLVGIVLAKSRHNDQLARARLQAQAVEQTDQLIADWWTRPQGVPIGEQGAVPGSDRLRWQTRVVDNREINQLGVRVVRVQVVDAPRSDRQRRHHSEQPGPLITVDLVVPDPEVEARERAAAEKAKAQEQKGADDA